MAIRLRVGFNLFALETRTAGEASIYEGRDRSASLTLPTRLRRWHTACPPPPSGARDSNET
jgi:hypothetical protein